MNYKKIAVIVMITLVASLFAGLALAEDGIMFRRNISKTPEGETEKAAIYMMDFYVPAQASTGLVYTEPITYTLADGSISEDYADRLYAKPLVSVYIDDIAHTLTADSLANAVTGGIALGQYDAFVGYSLDDGDSFRTENLSRSADLSSFVLANGEPYYGGVPYVVHQVAEDKILAVWVSKYCQSGFPLYSMTSDGELSTEETAYLADLETNYGKNALYLYDLFGVAGNQGSVDYEEQGWPEIGEIPYSCTWTARGKLLAGDDPMTTEIVEASHVVWTAPERLTSGVRDANLPAVDCAKGAGCALTWQEDPEGLRPGKGLGPGEGWSGAIANAKTDIWYSYITFADFDLVVNDDGDNLPEPAEAMLIEDYEALKLAEMDRPKPYVPMAMPVRLTDNDQCKATVSTATGMGEDPFCWIDFDTIDDWNNTNIIENLTLDGPEEGADFCATTQEWTNPGGTTLTICITEDGRWMTGRVASTRVRMVIKPYFPDGAATDLDGDLIPDDGSAWLSLAAEETKALGLTADTDGDGDTSDEIVDPVDIGKNMFYYSFDFAKPYNLSINPTLDEEKAYIVQQGGMINQPAKCSPYFITTDQTNPDISCPAPGEFYDTEIDPITGYEYYLTEISRRFALTENNIANITNPALGGSGLASMLIYKQGIIWQGGPADIMLRRTVVQPFCTDTDADGVVDNTDDCFDKTVENPYAFENMDCTNPDGTSGWIYPTDITGGYPTNPNYLEGLCMAPAINISGTTIVECTAGTDNETCAAAFPVADDGTIPDEADLTEDKFPKVKEWRQLPYEASVSIDGAAGDNFTGDLNDDYDLDDQSWENPYEVSKGHRGFLYGDMVMMMYAWSPNWQSNRVGNDHYNLYQRRSFDGGLTWTTVPEAFLSKVTLPEGAIAVADGTEYLEYYYGDTTGDYVSALYSYAEGAPEQARNLSLLTGNKVTILDPRYSPPGGLKQYSSISTDWLTANGITVPEDLPYPDDAAIDPSKYYMVYETGDNTTVAVGEAIPLDLFYSRATDFGDTYEFFDYENDTEDCIDADTGLIDWATCIQPRWPWLENATDDLSGEASVVLNPGGTFAYNVWNQWQEEILPDGHELIFNSDMIFRRLLYLPDDSEYVPDPVATILYVSTLAADQSEDEIIYLFGTAQAFGIEEIVQYRWMYEGSNGEVINLTDELGCEKQCNVPSRTLHPGWGEFSFDARDGKGWSKPVSVKILIAEELTEIHLPLIQQ